MRAFLFSKGGESINEKVKQVLNIIEDKFKSKEMKEAVAQVLQILFFTKKGKR